MFGIKKKITKIRQHQLFLPNDILVASFPKVGSTYTRFVFANLIHLFYKKEVANFHNISDILPELYKENFYEKWLYDSFPRIIKTHEVYQKSYKKAGEILYIIRDPRDTMLSYFSYTVAKKNVQAPKEIEKFIENEKFGIPALNRHIESYSPYYKTLFKYEDLMVDPLRCFDYYLNKHLKLNLNVELITKAIELSAPDKMKKIEIDMGRPTDNRYNENFRFIRNAKINQWKTEMTNDVNEMIMSLASPRFRELGYK